MSDPDYPIPTSVPGAASETTACKLERLSSAFVNIINHHDIHFTRKDTQELRAHISSEWRSSMDTQPNRLTWDEQLQMWKHSFEVTPDVRCYINHISSSVDERKGFATVYINMEFTGMGDVTLHAMVEVRWRRVRGSWECFYTLGMRGSPMNSGGLG